MITRNCIFIKHEIMLINNKIYNFLAEIYKNKTF